MCQVSNSDPSSGKTSAEVGESSDGGVVFSTYFSGTFDSITVAVKRSTHSTNQPIVHSQLQRFNREIHILTSCRHENIMPMLAACPDPSCLCIVYPFAEKGSLQDVLSDAPRRRLLNYRSRLQICMGACAALAYLHRRGENGEKSCVIVHRNVRPVKLLLSGSDGTVVRLAGLENAVILEEDPDGSGTDCCVLKEYPDGVAAGVGCAGYLDPLFNETGELNLLSDVYSFGVVMLQLLTGAAIAFDQLQRPPGLVARVRVQFNDGKGYVASDCEWPDELRSKLYRLALQCVSLRAEDRPTDCAELHARINCLIGAAQR